MTPQSREALRSRIHGLYALTPETDDTSALCSQVAAAASGGAALLQYRNKHSTRARQQEQAQALREICVQHGCLFIVNDDPALARTVAADGVHLGRDDGKVAAARAILGEDRIIGVSCYDQLDHAGEAVAAGADYLAFGSFYPSAVKPNAVRAEPYLLRAARERWPLPLVAIGGITVANALPLIESGADAIAVISGVFGASDIAMRAAEFTALFHSSRSATQPVHRS